MRWIHVMALMAIGSANAFILRAPFTSTLHQHHAYAEKDCVSSRMSWTAVVCSKQTLRRPGSPALTVRMQQQPSGPSPETESEQGSVLGASLLFAGTAIGAGMLALPAETSPAGFVPSELSLLLCWIFTFTTSLVTLEASWFVSQDKQTFPEGAGFLSFSRATLGPVGEVVTAALFWFLLTSIIVAYTSKGGELLALAMGVGSGQGSAAFMAFFAMLAIFGTEIVDLVNRFMVAGLVLTFAGLVALGLPHVQGSLLLRADFSAIWPTSISIGILSFGAQNVVPTLLQYLGGNPRRTRMAVLGGSLIPLAMYSLWEMVFLGNVPFSEDGGGMQVMNALGSSAGPYAQVLVTGFSVFAIASSMAGAAVSIVDFFSDALSSYLDPAAQGDSAGEQSGVGKRALAASLALAPPLALACKYPDSFLGALENAGLLGGVSLYGLLPALAVMSLRRQGEHVQQEETGSMPGRLGGGQAGLWAVSIVSATLVFPELLRLAGVSY